MCVFLISPVPIAEPLTSELIDTPVFHNLAPRPIKYRVSVPIPTLNACFFLLEHQRVFESSVIVVYESLSCPRCEKISTSYSHCWKWFKYTKMQETKELVGAEGFF